MSRSNFLPRYFDFRLIPGLKSMNRFTDVFKLAFLLCLLALAGELRAGEVVEQPCQLNYYPEALWSAPLYHSLLMPGDSDPVKIKFRTRYNTGLSPALYEVFIDWIASTGTTSEQTLASLWSISADSLLRKVGLELLLQNPMGFPPNLADNNPSIVRQSIVSGLCFEQKTKANAPTQYIATCQNDFCGYTWFDIGWNLSNEREYVDHEVVYVILNSTCPEITTQPTDLSGCVGSSVNLTVSSTVPNPGSHTYQWQIKQNGWQSIAGASAQTYQLTGLLQSMDQYEYRVIVSDNCGQEESNAVTLTVINVPTITTQPADFSVTAGNDARFLVVASSNAALTYQWQVDSGGGWTNLSGETNPDLTLTAVSVGMDGYLYRVKVTNTCGTVDSNAGVLDVN